MNPREAAGLHAIDSTMIERQRERERERERESKMKEWATELRKTAQETISDQK